MHGMTYCDNDGRAAELICCSFCAHLELSDCGSCTMMLHSEAEVCQMYRKIPSEQEAERLRHILDTRGVKSF